MVTVTSQRIATRGRLLLLVGCIACTGCSWGGGGKWKFAKLDPRRVMGKKSEKADPEIPARLVATWTDTVLHKVGQPSQRGFGGRLVFFQNESKDPVRVDGQLVVYAFDETDRLAHETQPTRRYIFPREQFEKQESDSKLGATYSVWLPWDEVGGTQKKISLIARFEPAGGPVVLGEQTRHLLPGLTLPETQLAAAPGATAQSLPTGPPANPVQLAGFAQPPPDQSPAIPLRTSAAQSLEPQTQISTMSVRLPRQLGHAPALPLRSATATRSHSGTTAPPAASPPTPAGDQSPPQQPAAIAQPGTTDVYSLRAQALRDSVRATHPARAMPVVRPAYGRVQ